MLEKRDCRKRCRSRPGKRCWIGIICILMALLILLISAPGWLIAFIIAMLLLALGFYCIGIGPR